MNAIQAWQDALGTDFVITDKAALTQAATATFATTQQITAILRPATVAQVQACVRIANMHQAPLYPSSRGRSWGLGSRVPPKTGCTLLDLSRLDQIVAYDEKLATITLQTGVTFSQVHNFLAEQNATHFLSVTGGPADGSVVANTIVRGDGIGPYGQRLDHSCNWQIVLPNGDLIHTGFGAYGSPPIADLYRWGVGPALEGLFSQANLGIVTQLTIWLQPKPAHLQTFSARFVPEQLTELVEAIRPLLLQNIIRSHSLTLWNPYKIASVQGQKGQVRLSPRWQLSGTLYNPSHAHAAADRAFIEAALTPHLRRLTFQNYTSDHLPAKKAVGVPNNNNIRSTYWRKAGPIPDDMNPDRDRCGTVWLSVAVPCTGNDVAKAVKLVETAVTHHNFEPNIGILFLAGRALHLFLALMYDRDVAGQDAQAMACHDDVLAQLVEAGYLPHRLGIHSRDFLMQQSEGNQVLQRVLKTAVDPHAILAPDPTPKEIP